MRSKKFSLKAFPQQNEWKLTDSNTCCTLFDGIDSRLLSWAELLKRLVMAAASLWGVTTGGIRGNDDDSCNTPVVQHFEWSQICQRWAINTLIAVIVLTLLTLLVTYFGHTFSLENNRLYFLILLISLFAIGFVISALFCTNKKRKNDSKQKKPTEGQRDSNSQPRDTTTTNSDANTGVNAIAIDL